MFPRILVGALFALGVVAQAANPQKSVVAFSINQNVGPGNEVFVTGSHSDLSSGGAQPLGVKLHWTPGNTWTGSIAIEAGAQLTYSYVNRPISITGYCDGTFATLGSPIALTVPAAAAPPYGGKFIRYLSSWSAAHVYYRDLSLNGSWTSAAMQRVGAGRVAGESLYEVGGIAAPGDEMEFIFYDDNGHFDNAPAPPQNAPQGAAPAIPEPYKSLSAPYNYKSRLDVFTVQDGQLFNYDPPDAVSSPTIASVFVNSSVNGIPGRYIHVYLPRGYLQNTNRRYPVVYFHDGQNVFFPGGTFGTWDADRIATYEIAQGRMREAILVAVDNGNGYGSNRQIEYIPPGDQLTGQPAGTADKFVQFLRDNVLPTLDYNYRTLNPPGQPVVPAANLTVGSSLGGLLTSYIGMTNSSTFGKIGVFSPAFWAGPNFINTTLNPAPKLPLTIYMDIGSSESSASQSSSQVYWNDAFTIYNTWLGDGYAVNSELLMFPQCGASHNEKAWSGRLPTFFQFALNLSSELNPIALSKFPPRLELVSVNAASGIAHLHFLAPLGVSFNLMHSADLAAWPDPTYFAPTKLIWEDRYVDEAFAPSTIRRFWRLQATLP